MKAGIYTKLLLLMCLRGAQSQAAGVGDVFDCKKGALNTNSKTHVSEGGPDAKKYKIEITGTAAPYDVTLSSKTDKFFEAYVGLYADNDEPVTDGLTVPPSVPPTSGKVEECSADTKTLVAHVHTTTDTAEFKMTFTPKPEFTKEADKMITAKGFVCSKAAATGKTPCSAQIASAAFKVKKSGGGGPEITTETAAPNPDGPTTDAPKPPGPKPDGPKKPDDTPPSAPHGSSPNAAFRWKATNTLPTAFMVPALVTLLIIIALRRFPVSPYAFITMY